MIRKHIIMILKHQILTLVFLFTGILLNAQEQWIVEKAETNAQLNSIQMIDQNYGWIVGDNGAILFKDKGRWVLYPKITEEDLYAVKLNHIGSGWAVGEGGTILKLEGTKWRQYPSPTKATLYDIDFFSTGDGIAVGDHGTVLKYDSGKWNLFSGSTAKGRFYCVSVRDDMAMVAGGMEYGKVPVINIQKDNFGEYTESFDPGYIEIRDIAFTNGTNSFAVGTAGTILYNNGMTRTRDKIFNKIPTLNSVVFLNENDGLAVGYFGTLLKYSGTGWKKETVPVKAGLNGASICETGYYAVGDNGIILFRVRKSNRLEEIDAINSAIQVEAFPNPSTDLIKIIIPQDDDFIASEITVTNGYGQVVLNNVLNSDLAGQVYRINTSGMKDGLYMIKITSANRKTALGKFIVKH